MRLGAVVLTLLLASTAAADQADLPAHPDPNAIEFAREANLVPESVREGFAIGVGLGPAVQLGYGVTTGSGVGTGFDLRLGAVASERWVWLVELAGTVYPQRGTDNQSNVLTFGGQWYVNDAFWLRGGAGFATFTRTTGGTETARVNGLGTLGAGGFDLLRRRGLALSIEAVSTLARYRGATVLGASLQIGLCWY